MRRVVLAAVAAVAVIAAVVVIMVSSAPQPQPDETALEEGGDSGTSRPADERTATVPDRL